MSSKQVSSNTSRSRTSNTSVDARNSKDLSGSESTSNVCIMMRGEGEEGGEKGGEKGVEKWEEKEREKWEEKEREKWGGEMEKYFVDSSQMLTTDMHKKGRQSYIWASCCVVLCCNYKRKEMIHKLRNKVLESGYMHDRFLIFLFWLHRLFLSLKTETCQLEWLWKIS